MDNEKTNTIQVRVKNVYGNELVYPACETSKLLCDLAGDKTITARSMILIKKLGYNPIVVADSMPF